MVGEGVGDKWENSEITLSSRGDVSALEIRFGVLMDEFCRRPSRGLEWRDPARGPMSLLMTGNLATELGIGVVVGGRGV
jgi:hypothetical protein